MKLKRVFGRQTGTFRQLMQSDYQWLKLGTINLQNTAYVYMMNMTGTTTYVDRIILVREK